MTTYQLIFTYLVVFASGLSVGGFLAGELLWRTFQRLLNENTLKVATIVGHYIMSTHAFRDDSIAVEKGIGE